MSRATLMQKVAKIAFILLTVAMLFLLFSNDFGLVDIHKASIVVAVGVDVTESGLRGHGAGRRSNSRAGRGERRIYTGHGRGGHGGGGGGRY